MEKIFSKDQANDSKKRKHARVLNSSKYLSAYLDENEQFHIGLLYEDYATNPFLSDYNLPKDFEEGLSFIPKIKRSVSKVNIKGKFVRKQPEEKTSKTVHISYTRKDGVFISYNRNFEVYVKELLHLYNISFTFKTNVHGQKVVVSPSLTYKNDYGNTMKNTHVINLFCEIFNDFEIFTSLLEPAIHFNKKFEMELLPHGTLNKDENFDEIIRISSHYVRNDRDQRAFQKRLHVLNEYQPDIRGKGPNNFFGYIVFGFTQLDIVLLESMYMDNATYIFKLSDYEKNIIQDKQSVINNELVIRRFYHDVNWEDKIRYFLDGKVKLLESIAI